MIGRVTSQQLAYGAQQTINGSKARLAVLNAQASSGVALTKPSDDPTGTAAALRIRSNIAANTQYATNIADGTAWLSTADTALSASEDLIRKAGDLTIQAGNSGTSSASSREAIATQLEGIKADLLSQANTKYLGRSVFAGDSDASAAFAADGTYNGTAGSGVQRRISGNETVTVSADGAAAFGTPGTGGAAGTSVFAKIDTIVAALRSSSYDTDTSSTGPQATVTAGITALQTSLSTMTAAHATVGSNYSRLDAAKTLTSNTATTLETQRSNVEDIDTTKVLLDLKTQELAYQTALQVTASTIQPTLMSFLS